MTYELAQQALTGILVGHSLFAVSYIGISLYFFQRSRRQQAVARYSAISAQIDSVTVEARSLNAEVNAYVMGMVAVALISMGMTADGAAAQSLLTGFEPAGLLTASDFPSSQIQEPRADISWCDHDFDYTVEEIAAWEAQYEVPCEEDEPAQRYSDWTVKRLRKSVELDHGKLKGYYKHARLVAIMEGDLSQL